MRYLVALLLLCHVSVCTLFLGANVPENPRSIKDMIGARIASVIPLLNTGHETVLLIVASAIPVLMASCMITAAEANRKLRAQIARMDRCERDASTVVLSAGLNLAAAKSGISALSGDSMEAQLLGIENAHGDVRRSLEQIEREHAERTERMRDKAEALTLQLTDTTKRVKALHEGDTALATIVADTQALRHELDAALAANEGESNLAELLEEAGKGMDEFDPRIAALETLKPKVIAARDAFAVLVTRLDEANGEGDDGLWKIFKKLKEGVDSFDEDELKPAETDENGNDLDVEFDDLPDLDDFDKRITALGELTLKMLAAKVKFDALKERLEEADGDGKNYLSDIFEKLKTDADQLDTDITAAGQDDSENELADELANIDLDDITTRITALEELLPKVLAAKEKLEGLRSRLTIIASIDIDEEIGSLQRGIERLGKVLEPLEEGDADEQAQELEEIATDLPKLAERFEALKTKLARA